MCAGWGKPTPHRELETNMPLYEYFCDNCQDTFEVIDKIDTFEENPPCPLCSMPGHRVFSSFSYKNQELGRAKFREEADERMYYAEKRLAEDKSLDPENWIKKVQAENAAKEMLKKVRR